MASSGYDSFGEFHAFFAASFGRKQWRELAGTIFRGCWCAGERRNAENLSESVGISARAMQRFPRGPVGRCDSDRAAAGIPGPRLAHPEAVWVLDGSDFPKQGTSVRGGSPAVLREAGQGGQLPGWDVPGLRQPAGAGMVDKGLYLPEMLDLGSGPLCGGGGARGARSYLHGVGMELLERARWATSRPAASSVADFREGLAGLGMRYVLDVPGSTPVWPLEPSLSRPGPLRGLRGSGAPASPGSGTGSVVPWSMVTSCLDC